jgi:hypothetical protein
MMFSCPPKTVDALRALDAAFAIASCWRARVVRGLRPGMPPGAIDQLSGTMGCCRPVSTDPRRPVADYWTLDT